MDAFLAGGARSVHEINLGDLLELARLRRRLPPRRALVGIQPGCLDWGIQPSPPVSLAVDEACDRVEALLGEWLS